jgi:hypothetical protein
MKPKTIEEAVAVVPMGTDGPVDSRDQQRWKAYLRTAYEGKSAGLGGVDVVVREREELGNTEFLAAHRGGSQRHSLR